MTRVLWERTTHPATPTIPGTTPSHMLDDYFFRKTDHLVMRALHSPPNKCRSIRVFPSSARCMRLGYRFILVARALTQRAPAPNGPSYTKICGLADTVCHSLDQDPIHHPPLSFVIISKTPEPGEQNGFNLIRIYISLITLFTQGQSLSAEHISAAHAEYPDLYLERR